MVSNFLFNPPPHQKKPPQQQQPKNNETTHPSSVTIFFKSILLGSVYFICQCALISSALIFQRAKKVQRIVADLLQPSQQNWSDWVSVTVRSSWWTQHLLNLFVFNADHWRPQAQVAGGYQWDVQLPSAEDLPTAGGWAVVRVWNIRRRDQKTCDFIE